MRSGARGGGTMTPATRWSAFSSLMSLARARQLHAMTGVEDAVLHRCEKPGQPAERRAAARGVELVEQNEGDGAARGRVTSAVQRARQRDRGWYLRQVD